MSEGELKTCIKCHVTKTLNEFTKDKKSKKGHRHICKDCSKQYLREWRNNNRERYRQLLRNNYQKHQPERMKYQRDYRKDKKKLKVHSLRKHNKTLQPLAQKCKLCDNTDKLRRHHPDYNFPEVYVTVCRTCHWWVHNG